MTFEFEDITVNLNGEDVVCNMTGEASVSYHHGDYELEDMSFELTDNNGDEIKVSDEDYKQISRDFEDSVIDYAIDNDEVYVWDREDYYADEFGYED